MKGDVLEELGEGKIICEGLFNKKKVRAEFFGIKKTKCLYISFVNLISFFNVFFM